MFRTETLHRIEFLHDRNTSGWPQPSQVKFAPKTLTGSCRRFGAGGGIDEAEFFSTLALLLSASVASISCRWHHRSQILACGVYQDSRKSFLFFKARHFFIRDKYCHLPLCLHLMVPICFFFNVIVPPSRKGLYPRASLLTEYQ